MFVGVDLGDLSAKEKNPCRVIDPDKDNENNLSLLSFDH
jgi:hypothetical protein